MLRLPSRFAAVILAFAPVFLQQRTWCHAEVLLIRAAWSGRAAARVLLGLLLGAFAPRGPVVLGLDDTIERRRGRRIGAKGIYRDPVRSSKGHFVKASGLRWLGRPLILVADSGFAALELLAALVRRGVTCVTRLRLDAALYAPAPPRRPGMVVGRPRTKGARLPTLAA